MFRFIFLFFILFSTFVYAQEVNKRALKLFDEALQLNRYNDYNGVIEKLEKAINIDANFQDAYGLLGETYKKLGKINIARDYYKKALDKSNGQNFNLYYLLGETELQLADYQSAASHLQIFLANAKNINEKYINQAKKYILDCGFAQDALKNPLPFQPINLGGNINTSYKEYFPALTADQQTLIFTRNVNGNEDFFTSTKLNGEWTTAQSLSRNINTPDYNEGAQSLSPDGRYLFFTGCNRPDGFGKCDIYVCVKQGKNWSKPLNLGKTINTTDWETQPSISSDGKTLYFLSNRKGGFGGDDIWKSSLDSTGNWTIPVNLGANINTSYNEAAPFIHADGKTLYFSSEGWPGMGGKDIYFSKMQGDGTFSKAINLGYPINTSKDEFGLVVSPDGSEGYFSSNFPNGYGDLDIYRFELPKSVRPELITYVKGILKDKETNQFIEGDVTLINLKNGKIAYNEITSPDDGEFMGITPVQNQYAFNILARGYMLYSHHFDFKNSDANKPQLFDINLEKIKKGKMVKLNNIFFETNKYDLLSASIVELNILIEFIKMNKNIVIEIQGHTDSIGNEKDNLILSENRAKSVFNYLVGNGIDAKQLSYKGFGKSRPATTNSTEEGRQFNRRTEFVVSKYE